MIIVKDKHIPEFFGCAIYKSKSNSIKFGFVFEYIPGDTLSGIYKGLSSKEKCNYIIQLCEVSLRLHKMKVIHRDIKPINILINTKSMMLYLIDFGVARIAKHTKTYSGSCSGTTRYMAPENFIDENKPNISFKIDIWSIGCVIFEMFSNDIPWKMEHELALQKKLLNKAPFPLTDQINDKNIIELIKLCVEIDPDKRIDCEMIIDIIKKFINMYD